MGSLLAVLLMVVAFAGIVNVMIWIADKTTNGEN